MNDMKIPRQGVASAHAQRLLYLDDLVVPVTIRRAMSDACTARKDSDSVVLHGLISFWSGVACVRMIIKSVNGTFEQPFKISDLGRTAEQFVKLLAGS